MPDHATPDAPLAATRRHALRRRATLLTLVPVLLAGCGSLPPRAGVPVDPAGQCARYLHDLDEAVARHGAGDAGARRLPGYPYLRATRFLASFRDEDLAPQALAEWLEYLRRTDADARQVELAALPETARGRLAEESAAIPGATHAGRVEYCGQLLVARDIRDPEHLARIRHGAQVPASYSTWQRVVGLYPIVQVFMRGLIDDLHQQLAPSFAEIPPASPADGALRRYAPAPAANRPLDVARVLARATAGSALGIPQPAPAEAAALLAHFAPIWEIGQRTGDDRIGRVAWDPAADAFGVDTGHPAQYRWLSHTRFGTASLLQLNYLVWLPARTARATNDIYAGRFDGLVWRVTLSADGTPLAYDSVHACGCYYLLFNTPATRPRPVAPFDEPVLVARQLAAPGPGRRLVVRLRPADHYVQQVYPDDGRAPAAVYRDRPYRELLSLGTGDGTRRSLFAPDGLLPASARAERWLLWPFGVASAGAMRRNGTHAIAFLGQRHFDDARLLETLLEAVP